MRKMILLIITIISLFSFNVYAEDNDTLEKVQEYLSQYTKYDNTFVIEEYVNNEEKNLFVRYNANNEEYYNWLENEDNTFEKLTYYDWFDYNTINYLYVHGARGKISYFKEYRIKNGIYYLNGIEPHVWIPKTGDELEKENKHFIALVTQEILNYNLNWSATLNTDENGEYDLNILESGVPSSRVAEVSGLCKSDDKQYKFVIQFEYKMSDESNGTYNTTYVSINDLDLLGEYTEFIGREISYVF